MSDWLKMGGYAAFVWTCYGSVLIGLIVMAWASIRHQRRMKRAADRLRDQLRAEATEGSGTQQMEAAE